MSSSRVLTSDKLVKSVRDRAMVPDDRATYTDEVILDIINEEMDVSLLSTLLTLNEEHLVTHVDIPYTRATNGRVKIPYRSIANKLRDVAYVSGTEVYELSRVSLEEISDYENGQNNQNLGLFYIEGDEVVFFGPLDAEFIRMYFYIRPNVIVPVENCGQIFNVDYTTGIIELSNIPADFTNLPEIDFIQARTPNKILKFDIDPISATKSSRIIQFNPSDLPAGLRKGDYVCKAGETPMPNVPTEMHPLLAQYAAIYILEGLNDDMGLKNANRKLLKMEESLQKILVDRVEGAPQKINPRHSPLVQTRITNGRRRR